MLNYRNVMSLNALMTFVYGFGSLLIPSRFWGIFGLDASGDGIWGLRMAGLLVVSNLYLVWTSRDFSDRASRMTVANFVVMIWGLYAVIALWGQLAGDFNMLNWANIIGAVFFASITFMIRSDLHTIDR